MRAHALLLAVLAPLTVPDARAASSRAEAPYPRSALVTGLAWDRGSYRSDGDGGDLWPVTATADGTLYTAWGDGAVRCGAKVSYGVATTRGEPNANLQGAGCGPTGQGRGKIGSLLAVGETLYAIVNLQDRPWPGPSFQVWRSADRGRSWQRPAWRFSGTAGALRPMNFVNFGPGGAGAPDDYVYMTAQKALPDAAQRSAYLMRAPRASLGLQGVYQYLVGTDAGGEAVWSAIAGAAMPVFEDPAGVDGPEVAWDAGLGRFLLTAGHGGGGRIGVFEGPSLWGPWATIDYEDRWLGMTGGEFLGLRFPPVWMRDGGRTLWAVFSCYGPGACGPFHDRFNLIRGSIGVARRPAGGTGGTTERSGATTTSSADAAGRGGAIVTVPTPARVTRAAGTTPARSLTPGGTVGLSDVLAGGTAWAMMPPSDAADCPGDGTDPAPTTAEAAEGGPLAGPVPQGEWPGARSPEDGHAADRSGGVGEACAGARSAAADPAERAVAAGAFPRAPEASGTRPRRRGAEREAEGDPECPAGMRLDALGGCVDRAAAAAAGDAPPDGPAAGSPPDAAAGRTVRIR